MRCGEMAILALISHPRYRGRKVWREAGVRNVANRLDKRLDFWIAACLAVSGRLSEDSGGDG